MTGESFGGPYFDPSIIGPDGKLSRLHKGGGGAPQETSSQKRAARLQEQLLKAQLKAIKKAAHVPAPAGLPKLDPAAPPPTQTANDVSQAEADARRQAIKRKGLLRSVLAGEKRAPTMGGATMLS